jgi:hypothetical protein
MEPRVDTTAPVLAIRTPAAGGVISGISDVLVDAEDHSRVSRVDLYVDGVFLSGDAVPPHEWPLDTTVISEGSHTLSAFAVDGAGNSAVSEAVTVVVDNSLPSVDIVTPADGASVSGTVLVSSAPFDATGIVRVVYILDGMEQATVDAAPWAWSWDTTSASNGSHALEALALDTAGNEARATVGVLVSNLAAVERTDTFSGSVTRQSPVADFAIDVGSSGLVEIEVRFSAGQQCSLDCELLSPSGSQVCRRAGVSLLRLQGMAGSSGTHTVRIRRVQKNATFSLKVTHP